MKALLEKALAALRWGWDRIVPALSWVANRVTAAFNTVYDPPPKTIRFWFWSWAAMVAVVWVAFAFTNSWFYKPTAQYFTSLFEDGDVFIPDIHEPKPLAPVADVVTELPSVEVVCHDMSDTPQCEPAGSNVSAGSVEVTEIPPPVAKPKLTSKARKKVNRRKHQPYQTYWGF
jgi:hypothetical protein